MNKKTYRTGAIGALMDEYERAAADLIKILHSLSQDKFVKIYDAKTKDEDCRSIKTIMNHVVDAGFRYAHQIRSFLKSKPESVKIIVETPEEAIKMLENVLFYTVDSVQNNWNMTETEIASTLTKTHWGMYTIEMMFEHAIVHILRHRRQIEKFILTDHQSI